ncbi:hypothetical protein AVEN_150960-1 [Araneus ventricosus]|uniref:Uncharacterized protein n=1 Tax=Araneus ventricosus TaxID=182803 RepID=A0A4Y2X293_ARAVE|nr:hypothetical protein AVEN_150960-1 [Araneus ventricosus]
MNEQLVSKGERWAKRGIDAPDASLRLAIHDSSIQSKFDRATPKPIVNVKNQSELPWCRTEGCLSKAGHSRAFRSTLFGARRSKTRRQCQNLMMALSGRNVWIFIRRTRQREGSLGS